MKRVMKLFALGGGLWLGAQVVLPLALQRFKPIVERTYLFGKEKKELIPIVKRKPPKSFVVSEGGVVVKIRNSSCRYEASIPYDLQVKYNIPKKVVMDIINDNPDPTVMVGGERKTVMEFHCYQALLFVNEIRKKGPPVLAILGTYKIKEDKKIRTALLLQGAAGYFIPLTPYEVEIRKVKNKGEDRIAVLDTKNYYGLFDLNGNRKFEEEDAFNEK